MFNHKAEAEFAALIGRVTMFWNDLQYSVLGLFEVVLMVPDEVASAAFFAIKADAGQRDMVEAVFRARFAHDPAFVSELSALMTQIGKTAGERNAAVHTAWSYWAQEKAMRPAMAWVPSGKLTADPKGQFEGLCQRIQELDERMLNIIDRANMALHVLPSLEKQFGQPPDPLAKP